MWTALLRCEQVSKHYGKLAAVDALSFDVMQGEVLGIGGPNGAGKTTLFDVITGISPATEGRILLRDVDITRASADRICQAGIARTFQLNANFDSLSVRENVEVAAYYGTRARLPNFFLGRSVRERSEAALRFVGLTGWDRQTTSISVFERKLLMIAGAMATDPAMILLDEPVGGLTPPEIDRVMAVVKRIVASGITIILIEHVMRFLLSLSTRVLIMHHGRKLFEGTPDQVTRDPEVRATYLGGAAVEVTRG